MVPRSLLFQGGRAIWRERPPRGHKKLRRERSRAAPTNTPQPQPRPELDVLRSAGGASSPLPAPPFSPCLVCRFGPPRWFKSRLALAISGAKIIHFRMFILGNGPSHILDLICLGRSPALSCHSLFNSFAAAEGSLLRTRRCRAPAWRARLARTRLSLPRTRRGRGSLKGRMRQMSSSTHSSG